jgi:2-oxoglutarate ferredoxin oxidoreductase subunit alpha
MGIPVSGKNVFPSNIQGLPTWYEIRVNGDGYTARTPEFDLVIAMNSSTYDRDVADLQPGGWLIFDSTWPLPRNLERPDITNFGVPLAAMCNEAFEGSRERILMTNIAYVGVLAAFIELDLGIIEALLEEQFGQKKRALLDSNYTALRLGYDHAKANFDCPLPIRLEKMAPPDDFILIDGNTAAALGCVYAGATVGAWYPITPSTSMMDAFRGFCERFRKDPESGKNRFMVVQAEDELSAAGIVIGAGWAGARSFTPTSGPGISLMSEFIGLAYYAEIPSVFFNVQRTGPSTGMPTRTQQGDLLLCAFASHGDTKHPLIFPADPNEAFHFAVQAFDIAERFQTPVFVLTDLDIGMNDWMVRRLEWDEAYRPDRGKILTAEQLEAMAVFHRYLDVDGDHIAARTLPGVHPKGAYFTRGSGHNKWGGYTEDSDEYIEVVDRLERKIRSAADALPQPVIRSRDGATMGIISLGGCDSAVIEAVDWLAERRFPMNYMRVRGFPFPQSVADFIAAHAVVYVVEQNRDAQLRTLLALETGVAVQSLRSVRRYGGLPMSRKFVVDGIHEQMDDGRAGALLSENHGARMEVPV